jgi:HK97 family phage major capsid protein
MTATRYVRAITSSSIEAAELGADGRTVTVRLVPWDAPREVIDPTGHRYVESFARGGMTLFDDGRGLPIYTEREHDGPVVGVLTSTEDRADGLYGTIRLSRSSVAADTAADLEGPDPILRYVSVDFLDRPVPRGAERVTRTAAMLRRVAFTLEPQHDAPVISVRSQPTPTTPTTPNEETTAMPDIIDPAAELDELEETDDETPGVLVGAGAPAPAAAAPAPAAVASTRSTRSAPARPGRAAGSPALNRFETFGHFVRAAADGRLEGDELARYQRALADIITTDAAGMVRETWVSEIIDLARSYTPTLNEWRRRPLPATGSDIKQPRVKTRPTTGVQTPELTEVTSTAVEHENVTWGIDTYAGGSRISLQTIRRAEPDYLNELMRLYVRELALDLNLAAVTQLNADAAVGVSGNAALEYVDAETFDELLVTASSGFMLDAQLRRPAEVVALSVELWAALANAKDLDGRPLYPDVNPMNTGGGTINAVDSMGSIRRIQWYVEPDLGAGIKGVVGIREAFVTAVGPMGTLTADVPANIARDVAVYQEAAFGASDPTALRQIVNAV